MDITEGRVKGRKGITEGRKEGREGCTGRKEG
jgi:hypothetical protein